VAFDDPQNLYQYDDIRTEFHPHSNRPSTTERFENYNPRARNVNPSSCSDEPWRPFRSRADFEFAEIALHAALNKNLTNALIRLIHRCVDKGGSFTLKNHSDMQDMWDKTSAKLTTVGNLADVVL
jgi:hypothetical protein